MDDSTLKKVIFTSLGPEKIFNSISGQSFEDGDVVALGQEDYTSAVIEAKFAQDWTEELEIKTKRLVASAEKTRTRILAKMAKING